MSDYTSVQKQFKYLRIMLNLAAFSILQPDHLISHLFLQKIFIVSLHRVPHSRASPVAQRLKRLPPMWETWVRSLGQEDPLEKEMVTHSSILAWRIPWTEKPGKLQSTGSQGVRHNWETSLSLSLYWVPHSVLGFGGWFSSVQSLCSVWLFETPWIGPSRFLLTMGFPRQEYWSGLPFPSPGDLPNPGTEFMSPALAGRCFTTGPTREAQFHRVRDRIGSMTTRS